MIKKYLYVVIGIGVLIFALSLAIQFFNEIPYLLTSWTAQVRISGDVIAWIFGLIVLYLGIKHEKINRLSNIALVLFILSPIVSGILSLFGCYSAGGACAQNTILFNNLSGWTMTYGLASSFVLMVSSLLINKNHVRTQ